ncbi:hypothetical protein C0J52_25842 [Blattella germanica]|nr:hypothetical protein C0J52_25842 [Blattella germanica]
MFICISLCPVKFLHTCQARAVELEIFLSMRPVWSSLPKPVTLRYVSGLSWISVGRQLFILLKRLLTPENQWPLQSGKAFPRPKNFLLCLIAEETSMPLMYAEVILKDNRTWYSTSYLDLDNPVIEKSENSLLLYPRVSPRSPRGKMLTLNACQNEIHDTVGLDENNLIRIERLLEKIDDWKCHKTYNVDYSTTVYYSTSLIELTQLNFIQGFEALRNGFNLSTNKNTACRQSKSSLFGKGGCALPSDNQFCIQSFLFYVAKLHVGVTSPVCGIITVHCPSLYLIQENLVSFLLVLPSTEVECSYVSDLNTECANTVVIINIFLGIRSYVFFILLMSSQVI